MLSIPLSAIALTLASVAMPLATERSPLSRLRGKIGWLLSVGLCGLGVASLMESLRFAEAVAAALLVVMAGVPTAATALGWRHRKGGSHAR